MPATAPALVHTTEFDARTGLPVAVAPDIVRVTAPNSGPYTFTGTNSYILGGSAVLVVDPGPDDDRHLAALLGAIGGRAVTAILLTHTHRDHSALAPRLRAATGAPLWFAGRHRPSRQRRWLEIDTVGRHSDRLLEPDRPVGAGDVLTVDGLALTAIATPGHCANHLCFGVSNTPWMLSGDHVMGWNSTLIPVPDGSMADYLDSLRRVIALPFRHYLPGHGGPIEDGPGRALALLQHREARNAAVLAAVAGGASHIGDLMRAIYRDLAPQLRPAARMTLKAHVEYLEAQGQLRARRGLFGTKLAPAG